MRAGSNGNSRHAATHKHLRAVRGKQPEMSPGRVPQTSPYFTSSLLDADGEQREKPPRRDPQASGRNPGKQPEKSPGRMPQTSLSFRSGVWNGLRKAVFKYDMRSSRLMCQHVSCAYACEANAHARTTKPDRRQSNQAPKPCQISWADGNSAHWRGNAGKSAGR